MFPLRGEAALADRVDSRVRGARDPADQAVDGGEPRGVDLLDVAKARDARPVSGEDAVGDLVDLDLELAAERGDRALKPVIPQANAGEE